MDSGERRLSETEHGAFRDFFARFYRSLLGFFIKRGCSEAEAEDFAQETLLNAYRGFSKFRKEASDATWIFSIAGNVWLNHLRSQSAQKRAIRPISLEGLERDEVEQSKPVESEADNSVLEQILDDERKAQLRSAIRELPEGRRRALLLRLLHGMKYREIANVLAIEVNTVKSHIAQAKRQLEQRFDPEITPAGKGSGT